MNLIVLHDDAPGLLFRFLCIMLAFFLSNLVSQMLKALFKHFSGIFPESSSFKEKIKVFFKRK